MKQTGRTDPRALDTARELALLIPNEAAMLLGSRARGDQQPDSAIEILLLIRNIQERIPNPHIQKAGEQAAAQVYGPDPHPQVMVFTMLPQTYQNTKHSRNFPAARMASGMVLAAGDPQEWERTPGDLSAEPAYAQKSALDALKATTIIAEWRTKYPDEEDDLVMKAQEALLSAHHAVASHAGLTIQEEESIQSIRSRLRRKGVNLPRTGIQIQQYNWFDRRDRQTYPPMAYDPHIASSVRNDVERALATVPALHKEARAQWNDWKKSRRNGD